jgi:hypothetical protein
VEALLSPPPIELVEDKVLTQLDRGGNHDDTKWHNNSNATNYMCGACTTFIKIDGWVQGSVRFSDGSVAKIEGCGTILFEGKEGMQRTLT